MTELSDEILMQRIREGDEKAFVVLVRRYAHRLLATIRYRVGDADAVGDILQETLLQSWIGLQRLQQPRNAGAWLLQIARNRCRDFHRSTQQCHRAMEADELEYLVNRRGQAQARERSTVDEIAAILQQMPDAEREVMQLFYLEGWTTAEIAARYQCPDGGTVRGRLSHSRDHVRQALGITRKGRSYVMRKKSATTKQQPFPKHRPRLKSKIPGQNSSRSITARCDGGLLSRR